MSQPTAVLSYIRKDDEFFGGCITAFRKSLLWVDDRRSNNIWERRALESYGMRFVSATTKDEAIQQIKSQSFDAIISDMGRPGDSRAGFKLLDHLRPKGVAAPYFIYCGTRAPPLAAEGKRRGAEGVTNDPDQLVKMVVAALR